jgi:hypothetical protein
VRTTVLIPGVFALSLATCKHTSDGRESLLAGVAADERCALVDAIIRHSASDPDDPSAHRVPFIEDHCTQMSAGWKGKLLIEAKAMPSDRNLFAAGEGCSTFWPFPTGGLHADDLPGFTFLLELTPDGFDAYRLHMWFRSLSNPMLGTCTTEDGRLERRNGNWTVIDATPPSQL